MCKLMDSYDQNVDELVEFYQRLNEPITFPDGIVTTLGIIYWGREEHLADLEYAIPRMETTGIHRFSELLDAIRPPGKMKNFSQSSGVSGELLRVLKHDLELWLPKPVPLGELEPIQKYAAHWATFASLGIHDQLQLLTAGQTPQSRQELAGQAGIPGEAVDEIVRCCDTYRTGANLKHIRTRIYYDMGLDTQQKWASATSEAIIAQFTIYIQQHGLATERLVPWPKEVRNSIEWAKMHQSIYAVEW